MRGLYAILDATTLDERRIAAVPFAEAVLAARPAAVQLRAKAWTARRTLDVLREVCRLAAAVGVPVYANDRPDLALLAGCAGVHLGQDDVPPEVARRLGPLRIGISTHNPAELDAALDDDELAYVAVGPVFATRSKAKPDPTLGLDGLDALVDRIRARHAGLPIVAIGGIDRATAASVARRADAVSVIAALLPDPRDEPVADDDVFFAAVQRRTAELVAAIEGARA